MKKIIFFLLFLSVSATSFSQPNIISTPLIKAAYLKKSKGQRTIAWILVGGGLVIAATGYVFGVDADFIGVNEIFIAYLYYSTGPAVMLGSIPFFISSAKNKERSMKLSFKKEAVPLIQKSSFVYKSVPSLTLKINL